MTEPDRIYRRITTEIKRQNRSILGVARDAGMSSPTIYRIKNFYPSAATVIALCDALDVSADWMLGINEKKQ